jgi:hypothetical protein
MKSLLIRVTAILVISICGHVEAKTIRYPQKDPLFRIAIPDSWTTTWENDGSLTCMPRDHSKYVSVIPSENVNTKSELKAQLSKTARDAGENAKMKDLKLSQLHETVRSNGLNLMSVNAQGTSRGKPMVFTLVAFAPKTDNYFTVIALEPAAARDKEIGAIINSISSAR